MSLTEDYVINKHDMPRAEYSSRRFDYLLDRIKGRAHDVVIVGFGQPFELQRAKELGLDVIGIDRDVSGTNQAKEKGLNVILAEADKGMPLADSSADLIVAHHVIEHMEHPKEFIKECHRVLRNEGYLAIETPDIKHNRLFYMDPTHLHPFDKQALESLISERFAIVWSQLFIPIPILWRYTLMAFRTPNPLGLRWANLLVIGRKGTYSTDDR